MTGVDWLAQVETLIHQWGAFYALWGVGISWFGLNVLIAVGLYRCIPNTLTAPAVPTILLIAVLMTIMPVVGWIGCVIGIMALPAYAHRAPRVAMYSANFPHFRQEKTPAVLSYAVGGARTRATSASFALSERVQSLIAINTGNHQDANAINAAILQDSEDELRLYSYSLLNQQEGKLNDAIHEMKQRLKTAEADQCAYYEKQLALLYWNLVYLNLVQADFVTEILNKAHHHASIALRTLSSDYVLWVLLGRIDLHRKAWDRAATYFERAAQCHAPANRVLPYLIELAFYQRNYARLKELVMADEALEDIPKLASIIAFWKHHDGCTTSS